MKVNPPRVINKPSLLLISLNLLVCTYVMGWTDLRSISGGPQNYFNAMVYFGITSYSLLEMRWSKQSLDLHNATLWLNCAWVCSFSSVLHHSFWLILWPTLTEPQQVWSSMVTPALCVAATVALIIRGQRFSTTSRAAEPGEPFDLAMIGFSLIASMLFIWTETTWSEVPWQWIAAKRPDSLELPPMGIAWLILCAALLFRLWPMYKLAIQNIPWSAADKALLMIAGVAMAATGAQLLWVSQTWNIEVVLYGSTLILWGALQAVLAGLSTLFNSKHANRNAVAIVAIGLQVGTCLIPGNMYKLIQLDITTSQALAYVLNNALFTMGLYFGMNGFGIKVYFLKRLKRFRMNYLGFKN